VRRAYLSTWYVAFLSHGGVACARICNICKTDARLLHLGHDNGAGRRSRASTRISGDAVSCRQACWFYAKTCARLYSVAATTLDAVAADLFGAAARRALPVSAASSQDVRATRAGRNRTGVGMLRTLYAGVRADRAGAEDKACLFYDACLPDYWRAVAACCAFLRHCYRADASLLYALLSRRAWKAG